MELWWSLCTFYLSLGFVNSGPTMEHLYKSLMSEYEKDLRPTISHLEPTNVTFGYLLHSIIDLNEKQQILKTRAWLNLNWVDHRLSWNASNFQGIKMLQLPYDKVWKPDVVLLNNGVQAFGTLMLSTDVYVTSGGNLTWLVSTILNSNCEIFMKQFPFDEQNCFMKFTSWSFDASEINLKIPTEAGDISAYQRNTEFDLISLNHGRGLKNNISWPIVAVSLKIQRRSFYYVFNHMMPGIVISSMSLVGFLIPSESGEKVTMYTTTMLSMGVYLRAINQIAPSYDEYSIVGIHFMLCLCMVCIITMLNILNLNNYANRTRLNLKPVPKWVKKWILGYVAKFLRVDLSPEFMETKKKFSVFNKSDMFDLPLLMGSSIAMGSPQQSPSRRKSAIIDSSLCPGLLIKQRKIDEKLQPAVRAIEFAFQNVLDNIWVSLLRNEKRIKRKDARNVIIWEWKAMSLILDRFLMVLFFVASLSTGTLFLLRPHSVF